MPQRDEITPKEKTMRERERERYACIMRREVTKSGRNLSANWKQKESIN